MVFDNVEEGVLRLLEVFIKTDSGWLVGKLQFYEPSTSISSRQLQPFRVRFGVVHLVHGQELSSLCIKFGQLLKRLSVRVCLTQSSYISKRTVFKVDTWWRSIKSRDNKW